MLIMRLLSGGISLTKFPSIPQRIDEHYHSIKDDIYEILLGKKRKQSARETSSPRKSPKVTIRKKKQSTTPISPPVQEKLDEEEIETMVKCEEDEKSYASEFVDSIKYDKKDEDEEKDDDVEKTGDVAEEKDNVDHTDQTLVKIHAMGSMETRNEQMKTPIPTLNRSHRKYLSYDKIIFEELMATVSSATATTSKPKSKKGFTLNKTEIISRSIVGMCRRRGQIRNHSKQNL
ncbi:hypothetical protein Tco_0293982 [Tanacetum coccineum]